MQDGKNNSNSNNSMFTGRLFLNRWRTDRIRVAYYPKDSLRWTFSKKIQERLQVSQTRPEDFVGRIIFTSMFNGIDWTKKILNCLSNSESQELRKKVSVWTWVFPRSRRRRQNGMERPPLNLTADEMVEIFKETGHPLFRGIRALNRGVVKRKCGRCTMHITAEAANTELLFRTILPANQLSINGAASSLCDYLAKQIPGQTHTVMLKYVSKANKQLNQKLEL